MKSIVYLLIVCTSFSCCSSSKENLPQAQPNPPGDPQVAQDLRNMLQQGIDFFGEGNVPVKWKLRMNYDDTVRFTAEDGLSLKTAYNQLKKEITTGRSIFSGKITGGDIIITVTEKGCTLPGEKEAYKKQVSVSFNSRSYTGCGKFLGDVMLSNKWLLEKIGNTPINPSEYNRVPVFEMDITKGRITGNDGCNSLSGQMEVQGNRIKFSSIVRTEMGCPKKDIGSILSAQISDKLVDYYFREGKLILYLSDDSILVFKKI